MSRRRRIKRDLASIPKKGIAGLRFDGLPASATNIDAAMPSTSQQAEASRTELNLIGPRMTSNELTLTPDPRQNDPGESSPDFLLRHEYRTIEEDEVSDEDYTGLEAEAVCPDASVNFDGSEVTNSDIAVNSGDNTETDYVDLETQLSNLCLHST